MAIWKEDENTANISFILMGNQMKKKSEISPSPILKLLLKCQARRKFHSL